MLFVILNIKCLARNFLYGEGHPNLYLRNPTSINVFRYVYSSGQVHTETYTRGAGSSRRNEGTLRIAYENGSGSRRT